MGAIKKAQLGKVVKQVGNKLTKKTVKTLLPTGEYTTITEGTPYFMPESKYYKRGLKMAMERRLNPEVAKKKMTKAQRQQFEIDNSYQRNGGKIRPKASNVSKKLGSAKKSIGNMRFAKKKK